MTELREGESLVDLQRNGLVIIQDRRRFCFGIDAVLLSGFAEVRSGETVLDLGTGTGILPLLLSAKTEAEKLIGLEIQPESAEMARRSVELNGLSDRAEVCWGDYRNVVKELPNGGFDFVISNPPYFAEKQGAMSPELKRATARAELTSSLTELCHAASRLCRSGGKVFFSFRTDRLAELLNEMVSAHLEPKRLRFIHHNALSAASVVLAEGRKDGKPGLRIDAPFLLHDEDGRESREYRKICRLE